MRARDNPFRVSRLEGLTYKPQGTTWADILQRLAELEYRAAIIGPEGTGKSTLLDALIPYLENTGFSVTLFQLQRECRRLSGDQWLMLSGCNSSGNAVLVDGADLLGPVDWWRVRRSVRRCGALVVTSHGRQLLPPLIRTATSVELLRELVAELPGANVEEKQLGRLFCNHDGNIRKCLREMFDLCADRKDDGSGQAGGNTVSCQ